MNIESKKYKIESAPGGPGYTLTQKAGPRGPAWHLYLKTAPAAGALAALSEKAFDRAAAAAFESGAWA